MRSVILIRHTKSDWTNLVLDFDRPVREDRKSDAAEVAKEINKKRAVPQLVISSPAKRTLQTAKILCEKWDTPVRKVVQVPTLYEGAVSDILTAIQNLDDAYEHIAVICHNPAITGFVNRFSNATVDNVPTTGAAMIHFDVSRWKDIDTAGELQWFLRPKELRKS